MRNAIGILEELKTPDCASANFEAGVLHQLPNGDYMTLEDVVSIVLIEKSMYSKDTLVITLRMGGVLNVRAPSLAEAEKWRDELALKVNAAKARAR